MKEWRDPIIQDVRIAGEELARQADYDLHTFFQNMRKNEERRNSKVVSRIESKVARSKMPDIR